MRKEKFEDEGWDEGKGAERRVWSWLMRVVFRVCWRRRARLSLRVSWSLRRRRWMDSGVGALGESGSWRFYGKCGISWIGF